MEKVTLNALARTVSARLKADPSAKERIGTPLSLRALELILATGLDVIGDALVDGNSVQLSPLGVLKPKQMKRTVYNNLHDPSKPLVLPPRRTAQLQVSKTLKQRMNGQTDS